MSDRCEIGPQMSAVVQGVSYFFGTHCLERLRWLAFKGLKLQKLYTKYEFESIISGHLGHSGPL